jgi:hypothetical protein
LSKFKRAFAPNPSPRYDQSAPLLIADEIVYVCSKPLYDDLITQAKDYETMIINMMKDFNPQNDVIIDFGDPLIFAMMVYHVSDFDPVYVGRYNKKLAKYTIATLSGWW